MFWVVTACFLLQFAWILTVGSLAVHLRTSHQAPSYQAPAYGAPAASAPADRVASPPPQSAYGDRAAAPVSYGASSDSSEAMRLREENLKRREELLAQKEKAIEDKERQVRVMAAEGGGKPNNWPLAAYPILYHDIEAEIPTEFQALVRLFYLVCLGTHVSKFKFVYVSITLTLTYTLFSV